MEDFSDKYNNTPLTYASLGDIFEVRVGFVETPLFTRMLEEILSDDAYADVQHLLRKDPERGDLIVGGGGVRKLRYALPGRGKSGGARIIYFWDVEDDLIYMLVIYMKSKKRNITRKELSLMRELVKELRNGKSFIR